MKKLSVLIAILGLALSTPLYAADEIKAATLSELLQMVKEGKLINRDENNRREKEFADDKARQQSALKNAERQQREEEARSERLETLQRGTELLRKGFSDGAWSH